MFVKKDLPLHKKQLNALVNDYVSKKNEVKEFYEHFPDKEGFKEAISSFKFNTNRSLLKEELLEQSRKVANGSKNSLSNIELLEKENTFTVTTGHQLCLFTGPLYFIYKIFSVINLCENLRKEFPLHNFVPVYWMASEDHDFEEVNHVNVFGKKIIWQTNQSGSVGSFDTKELEVVSKQLEDVFGISDNAKQLSQIFKDSYLTHTNLADATRYLVNHFFGEYGLVIVDGNSKSFKETFTHFFKKDVFENIASKNVSQTIERLVSKNYEAQVNPREINCFYTETGLRARIEKEGDKFRIIGTDKLLSREELEKLIDSTPESISPNVVLRPCYQQFILPNLAYVGGPGELAYWLQYKQMFDNLNLVFPVLVPRKMVTIVESGIKQKMEKLGINFESVYEEENTLIKNFLGKSDQGLDLNSYKKELEQLFGKINTAASGIDKTLGGAVDSEKQKSLNSIAAIEQKINKALKQRSETEINQIKVIKAKLFPNNLPQEREDNFSMYFIKWGWEFFKFLKENLNYDLKEMEQVFIVEKN